ncbi:hypothetical protein G6F43_008350 [Rhizopus delemar]|nr:hypothetical protein G6F43_008350 [Rhizopus delemar]
MTLQETHIPDTTRSLTNTRFQARHSIWTYHCGIVSFNPSFILSDNMIPEHDRMILTKVTHPSHAFAPFFILVLYVPASSGRQRQQFFDQAFELLHTQDLDINFDLLLITGDFNYSYTRSSLSSQTSLQWVSFLEDHSYNTVKKDDLHKLPTFRRNESTFSTIDYIFISQAWCSAVMASNLHKLNASWTDHSMLSVTCCVGTAPSGPGLWRGNLILARKSAFQQCLQEHLADILLKIPSGLNQELTEILALKSNVRWQEEGETSIKYLKNMYRQRTAEQHITALRTDDSADPVEDVDQLLSVTHQFYQSLYTADPVDDGQLDAYLNDIQDPPLLTSVQCGSLLAPITIEEIVHETAQVENKVSSPGEAGLGYVFLYQLF